MIILIFGPNAVGKSTTARELAAHMKRCAYVETDLLKYLIAGGLVAWSAGLRPKKHPEEYRRQIALRDANAAALARNFTEYDFDCVIEGLDLEIVGPCTGWAEEHLPGLEVRYIAIACDPEIAMNRWMERDGVTGDINRYIEWQKTVANPDSGLDYVLDTSTKPVDECIAECAAALGTSLAETALAYGVEWDTVKHVE
jgi:chloramphenicol 3-O-phosphotransferase